MFTFGNPVGNIQEKGNVMDDDGEKQES